METDIELARRLQAQFDRENDVAADTAQCRARTPDSEAASLELARRLQMEFESEAANVEMAPYLPPEYRTPSKARDRGGRGQTAGLSCVSQEWETIDPTPDLHALFVEFNETFFWGKLLMCEVRWSPRMYKCAGICRYSPRERFCTIGISIPLLKLRPRKDLVETLLHEMIHAFLFVTDNNDDHDGHGPQFHQHMYRINAATGASISVYHTFHDEVELYKTHWWRCDGPCTKRPPFYGFVKRPMNRAPGPNDRWWGQHQQTCGGAFIKVKEPEDYGKKKGKKKAAEKTPAAAAKSPGSDIRKFFGDKNPKPSANKMPKGLWDANNVPKTTGVGGGSQGKVSGLGGSGGGPSAPGGGTSRSGGGPGVSGGGGRGNIFGFGGTSFSGVQGGGGAGPSSRGRGGGGAGPSTRGRGGGGGSSSRGRGGRSGTVVVQPGRKLPADNSSRGSVVTHGKGHVMGSSSSSGQVVGSTTGQGHVVGSKTGHVSPRGGGNQSAREAVRRRWAETQTSSSSGPSSSSSQTRDDTSSTSTSESKGQNKDGDKVPCPVCSLQLPPASINSHLDTCLGQDMEDGEDDLLLAASIQVENSLIELSDSDDDQPLVKRRSDGAGCVEAEDGGGCVEAEDPRSQQDDQDILAALEDTCHVDPGNESMFACPICDKLLSHAEMFSHLDQCTQNI